MGTDCPPLCPKPRRPSRHPQAAEAGSHPFLVFRRSGLAAQLLRLAALVPLPLPLVVLVRLLAARRPLVLVRLRLELRLVLVRHSRPPVALMMAREGGIPLLLRLLKDQSDEETIATAACDLLSALTAAAAAAGSGGRGSGGEGAGGHAPSSVNGGSELACDVAGVVCAVRLHGHRLDLLRAAAYGRGRLVDDVAADLVDGSLSPEDLPGDLGRG